MTDNLKKEIANAEAAYKSQVDMVVQMLMTDTNRRYVLISGGSGAGKTTTTKILEEELLSRGRYVSKISLDDFYLDDIYDEYGNFTVDVESPEALDLPYLRECFAKLERGEIAKIPYFSFKTKRRTEDYTEIRMREGEVCLIEGLHALNPQIYGKEVDRKRLLKVFLHPIPQDVEGLSEPRLLRRMIRDYYHRAAPATTTFSMWDGVRAGEEKYILPFVPDADFVINTFFSYETGALKEEGVKILSEVPMDSVYYPRAEALLRELEKFPTYGTDIIPEDSLLNEFTE